MSKAAATKYRLLLVDDEPDNLDALARLFRRGYSIATATSGEAALELLEKERFEVLLTDQRMPGMSGSELCARARTVAPAMIRMIVTGHIDVEDLLGAIN